MSETARWTSQAAEHMLTRHGLTVGEANEVFDDDDALWYDPDPRSRSGLTARVIGWSYTRSQVVTVVLLHHGDGWLGMNGWVTKSGRDRSAYRRGQT